MSYWLYSGASVTGQSHLGTGTPCQDKFKVQTSPNGEWLAIAVCDGAGSAKFAEIGADITSKYFCEELIKLSLKLDTKPPGEWINDFIINCVLTVREHIRSIAKSDDIRDYHCTLVATLIGKSGGFLIHIGDGSIFGGKFFNDLNPSIIELNSDFIISKPENGEYANETYFITEGSWIKHLRVTPIPALDWLIVCTDGGASLTLDNNCNVKPNFLIPFIENHINDKFQDKKYIEGILGNAKANKLTTDDKTVILAVRNKLDDLPVVLQFTNKNTGNKESPQSLVLPDSYEDSVTRSISSKSKVKKHDVSQNAKKNFGNAARTKTKSIKIIVFLILLFLILLIVAIIYTNHPNFKLHEQVINKLDSISFEQDLSKSADITAPSEKTQKVIDEAAGN